MSNCYVRIYDKPLDQGKPATWLGASATPAYDLGKHITEFSDFFSARGRRITEVDLDNESNLDRIRMIGGVSWKYFEVVPPLSEEDFPALGRLCMRLIDPGDYSAFLMDNRHQPFPLTPSSSSSKVVQSWE